MFGRKGYAGSIAGRYRPGSRDRLIDNFEDYKFSRDIDLSPTDKVAWLEREDCSLFSHMETVELVSNLCSHIVKRAPEASNGLNRGDRIDVDVNKRYPRIRKESTLSRLKQVHFRHGIKFVTFMTCGVVFIKL